MRIDRIELREVALSLKNPFRTSFGVEQHRRITLVSLFSEGQEGIAECVAGEFPGYASETVDTAWHVIETYVAPLVVGKSFATANELLHALRFIRGHNMAVAAVEMAFWDLQAKQLNLPLWQLLGGQLRPIPVGISLGIQDTVEETVDLALRNVDLGYRRVKLKIEPGWDVKMVGAVRAALPSTDLSVDANSAYRLTDAPRLRELDEFRLAYIEQPLAHDDLIDHVALQAQLATAICLDESVHSAEDARKGLATGAGRVINVKTGRVRGYQAARMVHDVALTFGAPVWCGGMLESGVGRAHNLHLSTLPNFVLPGDTSSSSLYWHEDIVEQPLEAVNGLQQVPEGPGIGVTLKMDMVERLTQRRQELLPH